MDRGNITEDSWVIISHKHRFIFIKTNKTAGTSIEIALSRFCGYDDVITPIGRDEIIRRHLTSRVAQNYKLPYSKYTLLDWAWSIYNLKGLRFTQHCSAQRIKKYIGENIWNNYHKFCFERNPWDRVISLYYWVYKTEPRPSIAEFLDSDIPQRLKKRGYYNYTIGGGNCSRPCLPV